MRETFKNMQLFLSTHNILSVQSAETFKIFKLEFNDKRKITIDSQVIKLGSSIETIYRQFFGEKLYGKEAEAILEKIRTKLSEAEQKLNANASIEDLKRIVQNDSELKKLLKDVFNEDYNSEELKVIVNAEVRKIELKLNPKI